MEEIDHWLHETLSGIIRDAFFDARNAGETMYQGSDDAAARVLAVLLPSVARLRVEVEKLLAQWEADDGRHGPGQRWIQELRTAVERAGPIELRLEPDPDATSAPE